MPVGVWFSPERHRPVTWSPQDHRVRLSNRSLGPPNRAVRAANLTTAMAGRAAIGPGVVSDNMLPARQCHLTIPG
jgi:hypothetical protein